MAKIRIETHNEIQYAIIEDYGLAIAMFRSKKIEIFRLYTDGRESLIEEISEIDLAFRMDGSIVGVEINTGKDGN